MRKPSQKKAIDYANNMQKRIRERKGKTERKQTQKST